MVLKPGQVRTNMTKSFKNHTELVTVSDCVRGALRDLGNESVSNGVLKHEIAGFMAKLTTKFMPWMI